MDKLESIIINGLSGGSYPIEQFNEGKYWYEIIGYINHPDAKLQREERIIKLGNYFPQEIEEYDIVDVFFKSPIYDVFAKMYFHEIETERLSSREKGGNETCKFCGAKAQAIMIQTRSADEAATIKVSCLNTSCGKVYKIG